MNSIRKAAVSSCLKDQWTDPNAFFAKDKKGQKHYLKDPHGGVENEQIDSFLMGLLGVGTRTLATQGVQ
jgi:hypothetical protein